MRGTKKIPEKIVAPKSNYHEDLSKEQLLGGFLDKCYQEIGFKMERITDYDMQHQGIDVILSPDNKHILIDEKAQLSYLNKKLKTFSFELSYLIKDDWKLGWLYSTRKVTQGYFLVFDIMTKTNKISSIDDFISCEIVFISRQKLIDDLEKKGVTREFCMKYEMDARKYDKNGKIYILGYKDICFYHSTRLNEQPFNLILNKEYLLTVGKKIYPKT